MRWLAVVGATLVVALAGAWPAVAKSPPFSVTVAASPTAYSGSCPVIIKYTGEIDGDPAAKLQYQIARIVGGTPYLGPWTSAKIGATGKLLIYDSITVTAAQAGIETETLRVLPGPAEATVKVSVKCSAPTPVTPAPTISSKPSVTMVNPGVLTHITSAPSPSPKAPPFALAPNLAANPALQKFPAPINLTSRNSKDACAAHGGSAESFACYIALPAGKLVLDWDYPFPNKVDGYNIYRADTAAPSGPTTIHMIATVKPLMTQSDASLHFEVLEPQRSGACFAVTAFHGSAESDRSVRFCIAEGGVAKTATLNPDRIGTMVADFYVWVDKSIQDNMYTNKSPFIRDLLYLDVGYKHDASLWRDQAHSQVSQYTNSLFRGYVHFNAGALAGHQIAQARLNLVGGSTQGDFPGQLCLAHFGAADHLWNPGDMLNSTSQMGGGPYQGPDLHLDATSLVQSWANSPASNLGITMDGEQHLVIYDMVIVSNTCLTNFPTVTLDVMYY